MKYSSTQSGAPTGNPIANIFVIIVGALAIGASVVLGFFAFIIIASIVLILASVVGIRLWWFRRKLKRQGGPNAAHTKDEAAGVIEGEFRVVAEDNKDE